MVIVQARNIHAPPGQEGGGGGDRDALKAADQSEAKRLIRQQSTVEEMYRNG